MKQKRRAERKRLSVLGEIRKDKKAFVIFLILFLITLVILLHGVFVRDWNRVFTGGLTLILLLLPPLVEHRFSLHLPGALEVLVYIFVFSAGVLGEIGDYYQRFALWDVLLHAANGYMFAAFGFCLLPLFEKKSAERYGISAGFLSFVAFCFSMTVGTFWELFEYGVDALLHTDMQKDAFLHEIHSVKLSENGELTHLENIVRTEVWTQDGAHFSFAGYLDVGVVDTMKDLAVNALGAILFCAIGYLYLKRRRGRFAAYFIPVVGSRHGE